MVTRGKEFVSAWKRGELDQPVYLSRSSPIAGWWPVASINVWAEDEDFACVLGISQQGNQPLPELHSGVIDFDEDITYWTRDEINTYAFRQGQRLALAQWGVITADTSSSRRARVVAKMNAGPNALGEALAVEALEAKRAGELDLSAEIYRGALRCAEDGLRVIFHYGRAKTLFLLGQYEEALNHYMVSAEVALSQQTPQDPGPYDAGSNLNNIGWTVLMLSLDNNPPDWTQGLIRLSETQVQSIKAIYLEQRSALQNQWGNWTETALDLREVVSQNVLAVASQLVDLSTLPGYIEQGVTVCIGAYTVMRRESMATSINDLETAHKANTVYADLPGCDSPLFRVWIDNTFGGA